MPCFLYKCLCPPSGAHILGANRDPRDRCRSWNQVITAKCFPLQTRPVAAPPFGTDMVAEEVKTRNRVLPLQLLLQSDIARLFRGDDGFGGGFLRRGRLGRRIGGGGGSARRTRRGGDGS